MDLFTISELQRYSGVNVHSIRAWEKRYNALKPNRSKGNTRYYDGNQLRRLLNIVSLLHENYKISELCSMTDSMLSELLNNKLKDTKDISESDEFLVSQMVSSAIAFDESLFDKIYNRSVAKYGIENSYLKVIYPSVQRLGILWSMEGISVAQEHYITHLIRQKIISSIDILPINNHTINNWILFLPEGELHELGLLMANYLIRNAGHQSIYLGANTPFVAVKDTVKSTQPQFLLSFLVAKNDSESDQKYINSLAKAFPNAHIYIGADTGRTERLKKMKNITFLNSMPQFQQLIKQINEN